MEVALAPRRLTKPLEEACTQKKQIGLCVYLRPTDCTRAYCFVDEDGRLLDTAHKNKVAGICSELRERGYTLLTDFSEPYVPLNKKELKEFGFSEKNWIIGGYPFLGSTFGDNPFDG